MRGGNEGDSYDQLEGHTIMPSPRTTGHTLHRGLLMLAYATPHTSFHKPAWFDSYLEFVSVGVRPIASANEADVCFLVYEDDVRVSISADDFATVFLLAC